MPALKFTLCPVIPVPPSEEGGKPVVYEFPKEIPRITTQWSLEPAPENPKVTRLTTAAYIPFRDNESIYGAIPVAPGLIRISLDVPYALVAKYVEDCLRKNTLIDLSDENHPAIVSEFGPYSPSKEHPMHKAPPDNHLG